MSEFSFPFTGGGGGDDGPYSASFFAAILEGLFRQDETARANASVLYGSGNGTDDALEVAQTSPASNQVEIKAGKALIQGYYYLNDSDLAITIPANNDGSGFDRIDTIVLEIDFISNTVRGDIVTGTAAGVPVPPTLTKTATLYQVPLANIDVANLFTTILDADIDNTVRQQGIIWDELQGGTGQEGGYVAGNLLVGSATDTLSILSPPFQWGKLFYRSGESPLMGWLDDRTAFIYSTSGGGGISNGSFATEPLDNFSDPSGEIVSAVGSNQLTLFEGDYRLIWSVCSVNATAANTTRVAYRLRNTTAGTTITESNEIIVAAFQSQFFCSLYPVEFSMNGTDVLELQAYAGGTNVGSGSASTFRDIDFINGFVIQRLGD